MDSKVLDGLAVAASLVCTHGGLARRLAPEGQYLDMFVLESDCSDLSVCRGTG